MVSWSLLVPFMDPHLVLYLALVISFGRHRGVAHSFLRLF
ncbi:hypothetical protein FBUS_10629 [Fasciolopsis buskii]|uniref:Uncharacterized protein n=1 Tax=Fasciolopsis buskii TaxID=27845 RepID=A0A8E0VEZ0_9TREM|nr:hypothetical protein FBUS_10629 [Fasciolopsis buski]